jgi:hypothetical protein
VRKAPALRKGSDIDDALYSCGADERRELARAGGAMAEREKL